MAAVATDGPTEGRERGPRAGWRQDLDLDAEAERGLDELVLVEDEAFPAAADEADADARRRRLAREAEAVDQEVHDLLVGGLGLGRSRAPAVVARAVVPVARGAAAEAGPGREVRGEAAPAVVRQEAEVVEELRIRRARHEVVRVEVEAWAGHG